MVTAGDVLHGDHCVSGPPKGNSRVVAMLNIMGKKPGRKIRVRPNSLDGLSVLAASSEKTFTTTNKAFVVNR